MPTRRVGNILVEIDGKNDDPHEKTVYQKPMNRLRMVLTANAKPAIMSSEEDDRDARMH